MKKSLILFCMAPAIGAVVWHYRTTVVAYRLTLEVRVNGQTYVGSGVVATDWSRNSNPLATGEWASVDRGEAVAVDLGHNGLISLTLQGPYLQWQLPMVVYGDKAQGEDIGAYIHRLKNPRTPREIPHTALPLLVRFRDISRPSTIECVDPDKMAASFPPGTSVALVHATIAIVDESVTNGVIEKLLPWLALPRLEMDHLLAGPVWQWQAHWGQKRCLLLPSFLEATK